MVNSVIDINAENVLRKGLICHQHVLRNDLKEIKMFNNVRQITCPYCAGSRVDPNGDKCCYCNGEGYIYEEILNEGGNNERKRL